MWTYWETTAGIQYRCREEDADSASGLRQALVREASSDPMAAMKRPEDLRWFQDASSGTSCLPMVILKHQWKFESLSNKHLGLITFGPVSSMTA